MSGTCLVEVKTRQSNLRAAQVEEYLDVARDRGFDSVSTVSSSWPHEQASIR